MHNFRKILIILINSSSSNRSSKFTVCAVRHLQSSKKRKRFHYVKTRKNGYKHQKFWVWFDSTHVFWILIADLWYQHKKPLFGGFCRDIKAACLNWNPSCFPIKILMLFWSKVLIDCIKLFKMMKYNFLVNSGSVLYLQLIRQYSLEETIRILVIIKLFKSIIRHYFYLFFCSFILVDKYSGQIWMSNACSNGNTFSYKFFFLYNFFNYPLDFIFCFCRGKA